VKGVSGTGIATLLLALYLAMVVIKHRTPLLVSYVSQEAGFLRWGAAVLLWLFARGMLSGTPRDLLDATGNVAVVTALILGLGKNASSLNKLQSGVHSILIGG
jgi:hypothetical protein